MPTVRIYALAGTTLETPLLIRLMETIESSSTQQTLARLATLRFESLFPRVKTIVELDEVGPRGAMGHVTGT